LRGQKGFAVRRSDCQDFDPVRIAKEYEARAQVFVGPDRREVFSGFARLSRQIRAAVKLPLLRKDFMIDERKSSKPSSGRGRHPAHRGHLERRTVEKFHSLAMEAGLAALVEVHDETEFARALKLAPASSASTTAT